MSSRIIISGGGTGGHIFPAISIAQALKKKDPGADILFVGANGRMEMEKVPAAGFPIKGLPIAGLQRSFRPGAVLQNLALPFKLVHSILRARRIIKDFAPDAAVGVGGYASGPLLWAAGRLHIPYLIQEQNGFAGKTNKLLAKKAQKICVAYPHMERFFPADRIVLTGNPIRSSMGRASDALRLEACTFYNLNPQKKTILLTGGSLGSRTLNRCMVNYLQNTPKEEDVQFIWQCGKNGFDAAQRALDQHPCPHVKLHAFLMRMDLAYAVADVVISRAGAGTISELCSTGKACIFVPSPNVAEDHQTHNARAIADQEAALMITDSQAPDQLPRKAIELCRDGALLAKLSSNISKLSLPNAADTIAQMVLQLAKNTK